MRLLLCDAADGCARWLATGLAARGTSLEVVTSDALVRAPRWLHRVGAAGVELDVDLADGRRIRSAALTSVVNRLVHVPVHLLAATPDDLRYATAELYAFWLSWLEGLPCPVVNRAAPTGLSGAWLSDAEWLLRAGRSGLPTTPLRLDSGPPEPPDLGDRAPSLLVASGAVFGPPDAAGLVEGARTLARSAGFDLLELRLARDEAGALRVAGACALPDLRVGGEPVLDHLSEVLR